MPLFGRGAKEPSRQLPQHKGAHRARSVSTSTQQNTERNLRLQREAQERQREIDARRELGIQ